MVYGIKIYFHLWYLWVSLKLPGKKYDKSKHLLLGAPELGTQIPMHFKSFDYIFKVYTIQALYAKGNILVAIVVIRTEKLYASLGVEAP